MELWQKIRNVYPELTDDDFGTSGVIKLQDDSDGEGAYIAKWQYAKPIPDGLKVGK